ncbi:MAG: restriction endonuclease subunit R [Alkalinema sp. RU_4_3]|nr:restriction endonuclease subunit R [Alkalinema sp. RU_4_3]
MVQTIAAEQLTLYDLEQKFQLQRVYDRSFLAEWQNVVPDLAIGEQERLARVRQHYLHLGSRPMLEGMVKMVVVSPLLDLAGFFDAPFYSTSEASMNLTARDGKVTVRGKMDVLVLLDQLWVLVIESKRAEFSLKVGIPQVLAYMMAAPQGSSPIYGMVTNGSNFTFLKLVMASMPQYGQSDVFDIERGDDLAMVLQILKQLGQRVGGFH